MDKSWTPIISKAQPYFTELPAEVRMMIYRSVLDNVRLDVAPLFKPTVHIPPSRISSISDILLVNRTCYAEAQPVLYHNAKFILRRQPSINASRWLSRDRFIIKDLTIAECHLSSAQGLEELFPSLEKLTIQLPIRPPGRRSTTILTTTTATRARISMAHKILKVYDDMCHENIDDKEAHALEDKNNNLFKICYDDDMLWVLTLLGSRTDVNREPPKYRLLLNLDLCDAVPCVPCVPNRDQKGGDPRCIGVYNADMGMWNFAVGTKRIRIPEVFDGPLISI